MPAGRQVTSLYCKDVPAEHCWWICNATHCISTNPVYFDLVTCYVLHVSWLCVNLEFIYITETFCKCNVWIVSHIIQFDEGLGIERHGLQ